LDQLYEQIADFYDVDMGGNMAFDDVTFWVDRCLALDGRVLELGCGTGRISRALWEAGVDLICLDRSPAMLNRLIQNLPERPPLVRADMIDLPFRGGFDVVLCPYSLITTVLTGSARRKLVGDLFQLLRPGGQLLIDCFIPQPIPTDDQFHLNYDRAFGQGRLRRWTRIIPQSKQVNHVERRYQKIAADGSIENTINTRELVAPLDPSELDLLLHGAGFEVSATAWDYGRKFGPKDAQFVAMTGVRG